jgi:hypothetical protein
MAITTDAGNACQKSSGYFIYAYTAIRFIADEYFSPCKQLDIIIQNLPLDLESPFAALDQLYIRILQGVPTRHRGILSEILSAVVQFPSDLSPRDIDELLVLKPGSVGLILRPLHSVLNITDIRRIMRVHHASFLDFLNDETRSSDFYVGSGDHKAKLGYSILQVLAYTYDDPQKNLENLGVYWYVEMHFYVNKLILNSAIFRRHSLITPGWIQYITSLSPSLDLLPHIELINPDFILYCIFPSYGEDEREFLTWLKVSLSTAFFFSS